MTTTVGEDGQGSRLGFSLGSDQITFAVDTSIYPMDAVYGACYLFLEKCFVFLSRSTADSIEVRLTSREPAKAGELDSLAGEFANELLSQATRQRLSQSTARIREYYTAAALHAAASAPSIDDLLAELESEELGDDPLEIMVPWEEKHGGEGQEEAAGSTKDDPEISGG